MAVTYKDIDQLTAKASAVGTEKIVVSDTEYITPRQIAARATGLVASNTAAGTTQYVIAKTNLNATTGNHRVVFEVFGNSYSSAAPFFSVIQAVNSINGTFVSGYTRAVNMGKAVTYYVANIGGYVALYFQIDAGVSVWISCHAGANLDNRVTEVTMQSSAPTYDWRATATNTNLSGFLPLAGGTMTGSIIFDGGVPRIKFDVDTSRAKGIAWLNTSDTTVGQILMHNTAKSIYINATGASEIYNDAVGKYSLKIGENDLTYNTKTIWHAGNFTPHNITISSSEPTSSQGSDGDIWIVI